MSPDEKRKLESKKNQLADLIKDLQNGTLHLEDLDEDTKNGLASLFLGN